MFSRIITSAGIGRKLIIKIFLFSSLVTFLGTSLQLYLDYTNDIESIQETMGQIESSYLQSISSSPWYIDKKQVILVLNGILRLPNMQHVEIRQKGELFISAGQPQQDSIIQREFQLSHKFQGQDKELGVLKATASLTGIYERLWNRILVILSTQAVKTFLVSAFIFYIFYTLVGRHLIFMADYARRLDFKLLNAPLDLKRKPPQNSDELETLVQSINIMRKNIAQDIEERQQAEEALRESEEKYYAIFEQAGDSIVLVGIEKGGPAEFNEMAYKNLSYTPDEFRKLKISDIDVNQTQEENLKKIRERAQKGSFKFDAKHKTKDGEIRDVQVTGKFLTIQKKQYNLVIWNDITERVQADEKIKASLKEKEILLSEIHHRVKNNMQVISSLLRIQSDKIKDKQYADMFKESNDRIRSMSLVHEKLYQSKDFANVDFNGYVKSLVNSLFRSYGIDTNKIALKIEVEGVSLGVDTAVPCGLLINELVSNSLKDAFSEDKKGEISITLRSINEEEFELIVSDDGIGIPEDLDIRNTESFGMELISILAEDQLNGQIELDRTAGTRYQIRLKRQKYRPRI